MNWKVFGRKQSRGDLRYDYYPRIFLEGLRKNFRYLRIAGLRAETLNRWPLKYEAGVLTTQLQVSVGKCRLHLECNLTTLPHNPEDRNPCIHSREKPKSRIQKMNA
jgi:hypothetical protein